MSIVANKFKGIRAALCFNETVARASKADDDINILVLPSDYITLSEAVSTVQSWISTEFKSGRYEERLQMIENIEKNEMK
jgi:ribose 5-phosphate isomerase B